MPPTQNFPIYLYPLHNYKTHGLKFLVVNRGQNAKSIASAVGMFLQETQSFCVSYQVINESMVDFSWKSISGIIFNGINMSNVLKFNISQIINKIWYRKCTLMFRCYCKNTASGTYGTLALKIIFQCRTIVNAFIFILSCLSYSKSFTKLNYFVFLSFCIPLRFETQKY